MINIVSKPLEFDDELKKKIEFICDFCNTTPKIINGNIRNIEHTLFPVVVLGTILWMIENILTIMVLQKNNSIIILTGGRI